MDFREYQVQAQRTSNKELTKGKHLINGALGLCGEAGEVADLLKKAFMQGHKIDRSVVAEEIGDVLWYCAELAEWLGIPLDAIASQNIAKLKKRYPQGFSADRSVNREV